MSQRFKVGDKVVRINCDWGKHKVGDVAVISRVHNHIYFPDEPQDLFFTGHANGYCSLNYKLFRTVKRKVM